MKRKKLMLFFIFIIGLPIVGGGYYLYKNLSEKYINRKKNYFQSTENIEKFKKAMFFITGDKHINVNEAALRYIVYKNEVLKRAIIDLEKNFPKEAITNIDIPLLIQEEGNIFRKKNIFKSIMSFFSNSNIENTKQLLNFLKNSTFVLNTIKIESEDKSFALNTVFFFNKDLLEQNLLFQSMVEQSQEVSKVFSGQKPFVTEKINDTVYNFTLLKSEEYYIDLDDKKINQIIILIKDKKISKSEHIQALIELMYDSAIFNFLTKQKSEDKKTRKSVSKQKNFFFLKDKELDALQLAIFNYGTISNIKKIILISEKY